MDYRVERIRGAVGRDFIRENHYTRTCHNGPTCYGLFDRDRLIGVCAFATPCSENVRASVYGEDRKNEVTELHRLFVIDGTPKNTESWFVSRALKMLKKDKPHLTSVLSFSDTTEGHIGTVYQALNARYGGTTRSESVFYRDKDGRLRHPRQSGVNISRSAATAMGWTAERRGVKHRYVFFLASGRSARRLGDQCLIPNLPYPKKVAH